MFLLKVFNDRNPTTVLQTGPRGERCTRFGMTNRKENSVRVTVTTTRKGEEPGVYDGGRREFPKRRSNGWVGLRFEG